MAADRDLEFAVLCPAGFEQPLAQELKRLGLARVRPLTGSVSCFGSLADGYRACLWSRLASRVVLVLWRVGFETGEELYEACLDIPWERHVAPSSTIAVDVRGRSRAIRDPRYATLRVKDAVCDHMRAATGARPSVDADRPDVLVYVSLHEGKATVGVDLGGASLVDRGYRVARRGRGQGAGQAFVREDMAALMLDLAGWTGERAAAGGRLVDPVGSAPALGVEAACVALDRAPRLFRRHWGFEGWLGHDPAAWDAELSSARQAFDRARAGVAPCVAVACGDEGARAEAEEMARRAGVLGAMQALPCTGDRLALGDAPLPDATLACALPALAGRGGSGTSARAAALAAAARATALSEAPIVVLAPGDELGRALGSEPRTRFNVINGNEDAQILVYPSASEAARETERQLEAARERRARRAQLEADCGLAPEPAEAVPGGGAPEPAAEGAPAEALRPAEAPQAADAGVTTVELPDGPVRVLMPSSGQFAARLVKMARHRGRWARRTGVTCYRVYDADLPDYNVSIDLYEGGAATPGRWVVMSEYAAPREIEEGLASRRLSDALAIAPRVLGASPADTFLKVRRKSKGGSQYAGMRAEERRTALVEEGGLVFEVNFSDYLDTGLFLDHRLVRQMIREMAGGARFLNLFAYTGTASCYAASGGSPLTTTVDLSNTYLEWARRNMEQNGFSGPAHEYVRADVMPWIAEQRHGPRRWDLIYVDPPTFSNSARMRGRGFDLQAEHVELLIGASRLLARGGTIVFSCNLRGFKPDVEGLAKAGVGIEDVSAGSIPEDFARNAKVHRCYIVRRTD